MKCHNCNQNAKLQCSKCKRVYYCDAKCQLKHFKTHSPDCVGLKVFIYDFEKKTPVLVKDDPDIIGIISNDLKTFDITREQAELFGTLSNLLMDSNTDAPVKLDFSGKIIDLLFQVVFYNYDIFNEEEEDVIMQTFQLGNYLDSKKMMDEVKTYSFKQFITRLSVEKFNYYFNIFLKNYKKEVFALDNVSLLLLLKPKNQKIIELFYKHFENFKSMTEIEVIKFGNFLAMHEMSDMLYDFITIKISDSNWNTLFKLAVEKMYIEFAKTLITFKHCDIVIRPNLIETILEYGSLDLFKLALPKIYGVTEGVLVYAVRHDRKNIFDYLLSINITSGISAALQICIQYGKLYEFQKLLPLINLKFHGVDVFFEKCVKYDRLDMFKMIREIPKNVEPLFLLACNLGHLDFVKYLFEPEFDIEYCIKRAKSNGHDDVVKYLVFSNKRLKN